MVLRDDWPQGSIVCCPRRVRPSILSGSQSAATWKVPSTNFPFSAAMASRPCTPGKVSPQWLEMQWWAKKIHAAHRSQLETRAIGRDIVRFQCQKSPHIGTWLDAIPAPQLGLEISPPVFRLLIKWWLGLPINPSVDESTLVLCPFCSVRQMSLLTT